MMTAAKVSVAVVEDHTLFRQMLVGMIDALRGYRVVLEVANGKEYVNATVAPAAIVLVDLSMPVMDGYETIRWIRANQPESRPVALTLDNSLETMQRVMDAGGMGYLVKDMSRAIFLHALDQVTIEGHYFDPELVQQLPALRRPVVQDAPIEVLDRLTDREHLFIRLVAHEAEYTYQQIAGHMGVSERTVDGYRESVFAKFRVKSKAGLVIFAYKWGLVGAR